MDTTERLLEKQNLQVCFYLKFRGVNLQRGFPGDLVKNLLAIQEMRVRSLGWEGPLDKEMTTYSNILAQEMPWTEEPGGLQSTGWQSTLLFPWRKSVQTNPLKPRTANAADYGGSRLGFWSPL